MAEIAALAGSDFERDLYLEALTCGVGFVDRFRNRLDAGFDARADVSARMRDEKIYAKRFAPVELVDNSFDRFEPHSFIGRAEVHEVGIVGDHGRDAGLDSIALKLFDLLVRKRIRRPLARRLGENLDAFASDLLAAIQRLADFAGDRHVRAEEWTFGF